MMLSAKEVADLLDDAQYVRVEREWLDRVLAEREELGDEYEHEEHLTTYVEGFGYGAA